MLRNAVLQPPQRREGWYGDEHGTVRREKTRDFRKRATVVVDVFDDVRRKDQIKAAVGDG
jgi:hypothetical protein